MKVLVVGSGGREHAIAKALSTSSELFSFMSKKNPGIASLSEFHIGSETDPNEVVEYATEVGVDYAVIGPEAPLAEGVADALEDVGIFTFGPRRDVARLEFDKAWAREFMRKYSIRGYPGFVVCESVDEVENALRQIGEAAIKPSGLTGGKGVKVMGEHLHNEEEVLEYSSELLSAGHKVVVEEKLNGEEFTIQAFCDGTNLAFSPPVQDHKRAYEGDTGPNTGGMGSYSDANHLLPFLTQEEYDEACKIMKDVVKNVKNETNTPYRGVLYGQFMLTAEGVYVVEFNVRFGDPEALNILPIMRTDFSYVLQECAEGKLDDIDFEHKATVCKYLVPKGYPDNPVADSPVYVGDVGDALLFFASVYEKDGVIYTTRSRAVGVVGIADTLEEAEKKAERAIGNIRGELYHRKDIGTKELINKRVEHVKALKDLRGR
ncbi:phosphoribosylamine--glycine ligase [Methanosarcinales archaeon]|nr:MAG: phosphoribosylamine--glycine ligase [Methanosarcinales archaeon]